MTQTQQSTATLLITACWSVVVLVWVVGVFYNAVHGPVGDRRRVRRSYIGRAVAAAVIAGVVAIYVLLPARDWQSLRVDSLWATLLGAVVLLLSTAFTVWARVALGTMWSLDATVKKAHKLRTSGPYAVTRHPIYTGMLGMLAGSMLLSGVGRSLLVLLAGIAFFEARIREEERLMAATFPDEYLRYRRRVPRLVPGFGWRRRQ